MKTIIHGKTPTEPDITNRYLANLQNTVTEFGERKGIKFDGATLRDKGPESPESHFGADL